MIVVRAAAAVSVMGAAAAFFALPSAHAQGARPAASQSCIACHGVNGLSSLPSAPHLAGQPSDYLAAQLRDYRSGKRVNAVMNVAAKDLSDDDIATLAAWYASMKIEVKAP